MVKAMHAFAGDTREEYLRFQVGKLGHLGKEVGVELGLPAILHILLGATPLMQQPYILVAWFPLQGCLDVLLSFQVVLGAHPRLGSPEERLHIARIIL